MRQLVVIALLVTMLSIWLSSVSADSPSLSIAAMLLTIPAVVEFYRLMRDT